ncbi:MAG: T9SS type A sorting domain-containing protein [Chryseobacterium sp.]|jgi:hypothetical protein|uniref:T9SS type A sorting domain-containing protein n=1 Tax=Chryseobacterium sp. TaxID=1871047 RepID=UPI00282DA3AE|nr:T9SS type A sorting domain-containing protein [Chryseobacterium sp.]MDR2234798.1 T9SS type A sorting domain-containing protein [Chryseobacterium sp.]
MKLKCAVLALIPGFLLAQNFPYQRDWATYSGGFNTEISSIYEDLQNNTVITDGISGYELNSPAQPADYYNQFITPGGHPYTTVTTFPSGNEFHNKFSSSGNLLLSEYPFVGKYVRFRDQSGNIYFIEKGNSSPLPSGVWLSEPVINSDMILSKYDSNNVLLWRTYIPGGNTYSFADDDQGNIYFTGTTIWQNLGDPETFQPDFTSIQNLDGTLRPNSYIVKLNPQGQKIWATYTPSKLIMCMSAYAGNLYIAGADDLLEANAALATPATFQQARSAQFLSKISGDNGKRIWGTYYGIPSINSGQIVGIKTTSTGIYIAGNTANPSTYYATEGAYKAQSTDWIDLFLTKFDESGKRAWSTYLGGDDIDFVTSYSFLDVKNDKILLSGSSYGTQNIASPGAFVSTKLNPQREDAFFSMFTTSGIHLFTSYYGGHDNINTDGLYYPTDISCRFSKNSDAFYLFGSTENPNGFSTANGHQQNIIYPPVEVRGKTGFVAKFSSTVLSTAETNTGKDLVLYNNPNNGNFSLKGGVLEKESHLITITDMSGRLVYSVPTSKKTEEHFSLAGKLENGNYLLSVTKTDKTPVKTFKLIIKK